MAIGLVRSAGSIQVYPRIFTPNGDGANDKVLIVLDNPALLPIQGEVFDVEGAKVGDLAAGPQPDTTLVWDGRRSGTAVPSGIYFYRVELGPRVFTGTVVVAQ